MSEIEYEKVGSGWRPRVLPPGGPPEWKTCPIPLDGLIVIPGTDDRTLEIWEIGKSVRVRWIGPRWDSAHLHDDVVLRPKAFGVLSGPMVVVHVEWTAKETTCRLPALDDIVADRLVEWTWSWNEAGKDCSVTLARKAGNRHSWRLNRSLEPAEFPAAIHVAKRLGKIRLKLQPEWRSPQGSWWLGLDIPVPLPRAPDRNSMATEIILRLDDKAERRCVPSGSRVVSDEGGSYALCASGPGDQYVLLRETGAEPLRISDLAGATGLAIDAQLPSHWSGRHQVPLPTIDWAQIVPKKVRYAATVARRGEINFPTIPEGAEVTFGPERPLVHGTSKVLPVQLAPPHNRSELPWLENGTLPSKDKEWKELHEAPGGYLLFAEQDSREYGVLVSAVAAPRCPGAWEPLRSSSQEAFDLISWHGLIDRAKKVEYCIDDRGAKRSIGAIRFETGFELDRDFTAAAPFGQVAMVFGELSWRGLDPRGATLRHLKGGDASVNSTFLWLNESSSTLQEQRTGLLLDLVPEQEVVLVLTGQIRAGMRTLPMLACARGRLPRLVGILDPDNLNGSTDAASGGASMPVGRGEWTLEEDIESGRRELPEVLKEAWGNVRVSTADSGSAGGVSWSRRGKLGEPSEIRFGEAADGLRADRVYVWRKVAQTGALAESGRREVDLKPGSAPKGNPRSDFPDEAP